ncbi:NF-kappa-B-repressing factor isoform X2 [Cephus cinctus]|uniref:NF-kappa-B-repressing factor isoform X2 n=1 Tax=Cephus cinctus TaxID=211228 RepID=A0AAJ7C1C1_CEPCN|nr:NF-kappa-B-repressing factor isoform X2 [Cephus cinctus]
MKKLAINVLLRVKLLPYILILPWKRYRGFNTVIKTCTIMGSSEEWDVEQHKMEHECDEHWELRRKFLLAHRDKFTEEELLCLAQVFTNVEFLGCRYPEETMQMIAELSQDVAKDYREKQKTKLQRTFVKASDAASAKVKGFNKYSGSSGSTTNSSIKDCISSSKKCRRTSLTTQPIKKMKWNSGKFGNIVLVEHGDSAPQSIIMNAVTASGSNLEWKYDKSESGCTCKIYINTKFLSEGCGCNQKAAKKEAAIAGLNELRKFHYTIKVKKMMGHNSESTISSKMLNTESVEDHRIPDDNIGMKLMKLMGWSGGGLGKEQQGIAEPIIVRQQISRKGFGLQDSSPNILQTLQKKCRQTLKEYKAGDMRTDLVFSADFTNDERAVIHRVAREFGLKSNSYGPKDQRTLIVSRKIDPWELVDELKTLGGYTEKYELVNPTNS